MQIGDDVLSRIYNVYIVTHSTYTRIIDSRIGACMWFSLYVVVSLHRRLSVGARRNLQVKLSCTL